MPEVSETIDIRAPIEAVFDALTDPRRITEWNAQVTQVRDIRGVPVGVGTVWQQTTMMAGRPMNLTCRVIRYQPPQLGVLEVSGDQRGLLTTRCAQMTGYVRVTQSIEFTPPGGMLGRMAAGMIGSALKSEMAKTMLRERDALEREYTRR